MAQTPNQIALSQAQRNRGPAPDPERAALREKARGSSSASGSAAEKTARLAAEAALDKKGEEVLLIDLRGFSSYADFLVLASGQSDRQLDAIADGVEKSLKDAGQRPVGAEGQSGGRWILLDFGDVVVHVFHQEERSHYDLEGLWADAPQTRVDPRPPGAAASAPAP